MGTRSVVTIRDNAGSDSPGRQLVALYRHWDGYPAINGAVLVEALMGTNDPTEVVARLLSHMQPATSFRKERRDYELTTAAEFHGDLEHTYDIYLTKDGWRIKHRVFDLMSNTWSGSKSSVLGYVPLAEFIESVVNRDRKAMNARMRAKGMDKPPHNWEEFPMVEVKGD